jgi:hypothetical protein
MAIRDPKQPTLSQVKIELFLLSKIRYKIHTKNFQQPLDFLFSRRISKSSPTCADRLSIDPAPLFHEGCRQATLSFL